jgi:hypothetical protein
VVELAFSNLQRANLTMLMAMRDDIKRDLVSACCRYGLEADQAAFIEALSVDDVLALVANLDDECLFPPRRDLLRLLDTPIPLAGAVASVRPPFNTSSDPSDER